MMFPGVATRSLCVILTLAVSGINVSHQQLIINVRNQGGEVLQENISANVSDDTVNLEFQRSDGTLVTQLIDFRNEVQILKALILGEEERGQSQYQVMCFVFHFPKDAFISSDAMSKLRQKNPGTVRTPEEDRGRENFTMDYTVDVTRAAVISPHVPDVCAEAVGSTFTRYEDVQIWSTVQGLPESAYMSALKRFPTVPDPMLVNEVLARRGRPDAAPGNDEGDVLAGCSSTKKVWSPCQCHLELCVGWYPCGLKYCKGKGDAKSSSTMTYRCGIKTCRKCHLFSYYVAQKQTCLWDE